MLNIFLPLEKKLRQYPWYVQPYHFFLDCVWHRAEAVRAIFRGKIGFFSQGPWNK